jgi:hypothetical protein
LSILGTWRGEPGEECMTQQSCGQETNCQGRSSQGFLSVLMSILSLMNNDPVLPTQGHSRLTPSQYRNEPGFEDYDKSGQDDPPTPLTASASPSPPPNTVALAPAPPLSHAFAFHHRRRLGHVNEAKAYVQKIRHETLRISVIQRLEEYLNLDENGDPKRPGTPAVDGSKDTEQEGDDEVEDGAELTRIPSPSEPEIGMWVDLSKRLFLCYYDIYLVSTPRAFTQCSFSFWEADFDRKSLNEKANRSKKTKLSFQCPLRGAPTLCTGNSITNPSTRGYAKSGMPSTLKRNAGFKRARRLMQRGIGRRRIYSFNLVSVNRVSHQVEDRRRSLLRWRRIIRFFGPLYQAQPLPTQPPLVLGLTGWLVVHRPHWNKIRRRSLHCENGLPPDIPQRTTPRPCRHPLLPRKCLLRRNSLLPLLAPRKRRLPHRSPQGPLRQGHESRSVVCVESQVCGDVLAWRGSGEEGV